MGKAGTSTAGRVYYAVGRMVIVFEKYEAESSLEKTLIW